MKHYFVVAQVYDVWGDHIVVMPDDYALKLSPNEATIKYICERTESQMYEPMAGSSRSFDMKKLSKTYHPLIATVRVPVTRCFTHKTNRQYIQEEEK